jgi:hypothetical protein
VTTSQTTAILRLACLALAVGAAVAACGMTARPFDDGGLNADAGVDRDAEPQLPPTPARELVGVAGRVAGPTYTLDVELGHPVSQQPASGATHTLEGNAAIKP